MNETKLVKKDEESDNNKSILISQKLTNKIRLAIGGASVGGIPGLYNTFLTDNDPNSLLVLPMIIGALVVPMIPYRINKILEKSENKKRLKKPSETKTKITSIIDNYIKNIEYDQDIKNNYDKKYFLELIIENILNKQHRYKQILKEQKRDEIDRRVLNIQNKEEICIIITKILDNFIKTLGDKIEKKRLETITKFYTNLKQKLEKKEYDSFLSEVIKIMLDLDINSIDFLKLYSEQKT